MKNRNIFWGLLFIITAVLIVIDNTMVDGLEIGVVQILITVFMLCFIIKSITKLFWPGVLFPLAVLYLIYSKYIYVLSLSPLSTWQVLLVALFGSIGLSLVFKKKPKNLDTYSSYGHMGKKLEENTSDKNHTFFQRVNRIWTGRMSTSRHVSGRLPGISNRGIYREQRLRIHLVRAPFTLTR